MAYLSATDLYDLQVKGGIDEARYSEQGLLDAVVESSKMVDYIMPSDKAAMQSMDSVRNLQIPVIQDGSVTVGQTAGFNYIPSNLPTSAQYTFVAYDIFSGIRHTPSTYSSNSVDADFAKQTQLKKVLYEMANVKETILASVLETRKTQVLPEGQTQVSQADGTYVFQTSTDLLEVNKAAQKETMFSNLEVLMGANELGGNYRLATNRGGLAFQNQMKAMFGAGNSENLQALGFMADDRLHESGNIAAGSDIFNGWLIRDGSIGLVENYPFDFRNGTKVGGKEWSVSSMKLPFIKSNANIYINNEATDATALVNSSDNTMTTFEEMAIWDRFYVVYEYNSDLTTRPNPIVKIKGLTT
jgi:hypothetical protein